MGQASGEHAACNQTCQTKCAAMPRTLFELLKRANPLHALRCWEDVWMTSSGGHVPFLGTYTQPGDACHPPMLWTRPVEPPCMRAASGCLVCDYKPRAHWLPAGYMLTTLTGPGYKARTNTSICRCATRGDSSQWAWSLAHRPLSTASPGGRDTLTSRAASRPRW